MTQEERLTKIFHRGCLIDIAVIACQNIDPGVFGHYVESVLVTQGYNVDANGVDLPDLGIEVKTRQYKRQSATTLGRIHESEIEMHDSFESTGLSKMCKKQFRITWEVDERINKIRIRNSAVYDFTNADTQYMFNNHYKILKKNFNKHYFNSLKYVCTGDGYCFERQKHTKTWQYRATEAAVGRLCNRAASEIFLKDFTEPHQ